MKRLNSRLGRLESALAPRQTERFRVVCENVGRHLNLAKSSCTRYVAGGQLFEFVELDGSREHMPDADLEKFIQSFPIRDNDAVPEKTWHKGA